MSASTDVFEIQIMVKMHYSVIRVFFIIPLLAWIFSSIAQFFLIWKAKHLYTHQGKKKYYLQKSCLSKWQFILCWLPCGLM